MFEEEINKLINPVGWEITQDERETSTYIEFANSSGEKIIVLAQGLFSLDTLKMSIRFTDTYGRTMYYECDYKFFHREQSDDDRFHREKIDSISFWAMHNRIPVEVAKSSWLRTRPLFDEIQSIAIINALSARSDKEDDKAPEQKDLF